MAFLPRTGQNPHVAMEAVCTFCGKSVLREVREGQKLFHLYCYLLYKRHPSPF